MVGKAVCVECGRCCCRETGYKQNRHKWVVM